METPIYQWMIKIGVPPFMETPYIGYRNIFGTPYISWKPPFMDRFMEPPYIKKRRQSICPQNIVMFHPIS